MFFFICHFLPFFVLDGALREMGEAQGAHGEVENAAIYYNFVIPYIYIYILLFCYEQ